MRFELLVLLLALLVIFVFSGFMLGAYLVFFLLLADIFGGIITGFFSFIWGVGGGLAETAKEEAEEAGKAKVKYTSGKKFFEEGLTRTAKAIGKGEVAKAQGKKIKDERDDAEKIHTFVSDFMEGIGKILKK